MSLAPLLEAAPAIPLHAFAAMAAFALGVVQLAGPKGTLPHRALGWIWVSVMVLVALSSFWIHQIRLLGPWSPVVDLHAGDAAARRLDGAPTSGRPPSPHHALAVRRCARDRGAVHAGPGADHARRRVRQLARVPVAGFEAAAASLADRVSLWKNEEKNRARWSVKGGFSAPDALYDSITKN